MRVMAAGYVLVGGGFALNACANSIPALVCAMAIVTFGEMLTIPVSAAYIADLAPPHMRGRYMGANGLVWAAALVIGPGLGMKLFAIGPALLWLSCGVLGLLAATIILGEIKPRVEEPALAVKLEP